MGTKRAAREREETENRADWVRALKENPDRVLHPVGLPPGDFSVDQYHLLLTAQGGRSATDREDGANWRGLIPEFGEPVARAYRDAAVAHWRDYQPVLRSEGAPDELDPLFADLRDDGARDRGRRGQRLRAATDDGRGATRLPLHYLAAERLSELVRGALSRSLRGRPRSGEDGAGLGAGKQRRGRALPLHPARPALSCALAARHGRAGDPRVAARTRHTQRRCAALLPQHTNRRRDRLWRACGARRAKGHGLDSRRAEAEVVCALGG